MVPAVWSGYPRGDVRGDHAHLAPPAAATPPPRPHQGGGGARAVGEDPGAPRPAREGAVWSGIPLPCPGGCIYTYLYISTPVSTYLQHKYLHIYTIIHIYTPLYISTPVTSIHISTPVSTYLHQYLLSTVQSWRHVPGMEAHPMEYTPGAWQPCHQPGHHACLNNYPIQVAAARLLCSAHKLTSTLSG